MQHRDISHSHATYRWSKQPELTDELLRLIEGNEKWRVAFGFDKGSAVIASNGSTIIECCAQIVTEMFITNKPESKWMVADVGMLRQVVNALDLLMDIHSVR